MKIKTMTAALIMVSACAGAGAESLTPEQYCDPAVCSPASVREMRPMADGESYSCISDDEDSIEVLSFRTGKKTGTLFSVNDIKGDLKIDAFDGYALSDNGRKILLWNNKEMLYRHSFNAEYFVYDVMRQTLKRVSDKGRVRGAVLSHDGRLVAYVHENNIRIANLDYDTDYAVTTDGELNKIINGVTDWGYEEEFGYVNTMRWSADDNVLAFMRFDETNVPAYSFDVYKSYCEEDPLSDLYPKAYTYKYPLAGYPNSVVGVYAFNVVDRIVKKMDLPLNDLDYVPSLEYAGSSHNLMAMVLNRDQNKLRIFSVNDASTTARPVVTFTSEAWLSPATYQMVEYGDNDFVIADDSDGYRHLYRYDYKGTRLAKLTSGNFNVTDYYGYDSKRGRYYAQTSARGAINRNVCSFDRRGRMNVLHNVDGTESALFSKNFDYYLRSWSSASVPPQYTVWNVNGKKLSEVEMNTEYAAIYADAPKMEFLKVKNAVGEEMDAYIIRPAGFDASGKYPLLMQQYNGPDSQEVLNRWRMDGRYYIASQGYVVAAVDGRGTGGRDRAWAQCVYKKLGQIETEDQLAGAAWFASQQFVDADKTACFGWSYGGYMSLMELSDKACKFKCGVAMAPVTDWRFYDSIYTERYMLTPAQNEEGYNRASALDRTVNLNVPLLIMSGTSDDNVHFYNTLKYTSKLNYEGKIFDMMAFAGFEHSLRICNARTRLYVKITDWLNSELGLK